MNGDGILDEVYVLADPFGSEAFRGRVSVETDALALVRGETLPGAPLQIDHYQGDTLYDVVWTTKTAPIVVSRKVVDLLSEGTVSGWGTFEVDVRDRRGSPVPGYHGLSISGRAGPVREELSPVVDAIYPGGRFKDYLGLRFDPDSWDGSDLFVPEGGTIVFARDHVRRMFDRAKIRNVEFRRAAEVRQPAR